MTACTHRGDAVGELDFADGFFFFGAAFAQHRTGFDKHRGDDVVAAVDIGQQFVNQITAAAVVPDVMMRIDDGQVGFERRFPQLLRPRLQLSLMAKMTAVEFVVFAHRGVCFQMGCNRARGGCRQRCQRRLLPRDTV